MIWTGRILTALAALMMFASAAVKIGLATGMMKPAPGEDVFAHLGWAAGSILPLAILELSCLALYLFPKTSVLGAVLLAGYLGGAIASHVRIGDPFFGPLVPALLAWGGLYCLEPRVRALLPLRR